ncbi:uncharacterized protein LOC144350829 [Saccoglossus kowalevskii]
MEGNSNIIGLRPNFKHRVVFGLTTSQVIAASLSIVLGVLAIIENCVTAAIGAPVWGGIFVFATLILCIIAALFSLIVIVSSVTSLVNDNTCGDYGTYSYCFQKGCHVIDSIVVAVATAELVLTLTTTVVCWVAVCNCRARSYESGRPYIILNNSEPQPLLSGVPNLPVVTGPDISHHQRNRNSSRGQITTMTANENSLRTLTTSSFLVNNTRDVFNGNHRSSANAKHTERSDGETKTSAPEEHVTRSARQLSDENFEDISLKSRVNSEDTRLCELSAISLPENTDSTC